MKKTLIILPAYNVEREIYDLLCNMKNYREKTSGVEFVQLLKNSFKIGEKYTREYIKKELKRLYALVKTAPKNAITAMTIKDFFKIQECKIGNQKAIRILEPLI